MGCDVTGRLPRTTLTDAPQVEAERRRNQIATAVNGLAIPQDARVLTDVVFTAGQVRDISHGLTSRARGFLAVNARTSAPLLFRTLQSDALEARILRLTHSGASSTTFDLVVWP